MSRWQIFSDADNHFRWEISDEQIHEQQPDAPPILPSPNSSPLPSMADLLLQGCSKLIENREEHFQSPPMFRSGLGKSVTVKQSSITKALSILGGGDEANGFAYTGQLFNGSDDGCGFSNSMFQTGSGKKVNISTSNDGCGFSNSMFQTGSGEKVNISASNDACGFSNSMFQTGSGKKVNISSTGLVRAKTLLGLEENHDHDTFPVVEHSKNQSNYHQPFGWGNSSQLGTTEGVTPTRSKNDTTDPIPLFNFKNSTLGSDSKIDAIPDLIHSATRCPPIKFHTAGGRSISVSGDALQRAKSLLGDLELGTLFDEREANDPAFSFFKQGRLDENHSNKENNPPSTSCCQDTANTQHASMSFVSPLQSDSKCTQSSVRSENASIGSNLIKKFDAEDFDNTYKVSNNIVCQQKPPSSRPSLLVAKGSPLANGFSSRINPRGRSLGGPLVDISNKMAYTDSKPTTSEKRRVGRSSVSPFKRPRSSRFITPLNVLAAPNGLSTVAPEESCCRRRVSTQYPFQVPRIYVEEYFGVPPSHLNMPRQLPDHIRRMNAANAEKYMFCDGSGVVGAEAFYHKLVQSGASTQYASKEWVANHYKWIVWKLACYERSCPAKSCGKLLTISNVLEELKYRYEREVNHGHRSAIKRILEGDQAPSSMLVLCISSIYSNCDPKVETLPMASNGAENGTKVELTDGWYSINALLDTLLLKNLAAGKLFVGQKLRVWGAGLCGWVGPVSPLEASSAVSLQLHINGTYRAHWADRLGSCKGVGAPLAFRCIKGMGGPVPSTLVGVTRIYPVLYRERLSDGGFIVRSEKMEAKMIQLHNHRRSVIAEGIMSDFQRGNKEFQTNNDNDSEEGAKILKILETAAEPEVLMAEMTAEQLNSFTTYQAKLEDIRQSDMQKSIEKGLEDAGLNAREVTPFMRVRVVGLTHKNCITKCCPRKGLITIWNPTEKQQSELVEGKAYAVAGLMPFNTESDTLYLHARGSTTKWVPLSPSATEHFESFVNPRKSVLLSHLGEVSLSSEFDIAALVVHVGEVYADAFQRKQWVFVTDGSISDFHSEDTSNSLLAISFCSPYIDCDSYAPINYNLVGSAVGFCNLIKRAKDQINHLWVAEATENSTYFLSYDHVHCSHLKEASATTERWAKISSSTIEKLRRKVLSIVGNDEG